MAQHGEVTDWSRYDPTWLVQLAREQVPEHPWLPSALAQCTRSRWQGDAYLSFVDAQRPNESESEWQFLENIVLRHPVQGDLVLDILTEQRVGGVEFLSRIR